MNIIGIFMIIGIKYQVNIKKFSNRKMIDEENIFIRFHFKIVFKPCLSFKVTFFFLKL